MAPTSPPTLEAALTTVRDTYAGILHECAHDPARTPLDELFARLTKEIGDPDGSIALADGSRLFVIPEQGDRRGETGRLGLIQRFPDERADEIHLVTP